MRVLNKLGVCIGLLCCIFTLSAQESDYYLGTTRYSFIDYDINTLQIPAKASGFDHFYSALDTLILKGRGQLNIVHFGGSHIQADIYTHLIRQRLLDLSPGLSGGRGLVFPFNAAETNNPWNYKVQYTGTWEGCKCTRPADSCTLGVMGIVVTTEDSLATIRIDIEDEFPHTYRFNQVKVFHESLNYHLKLVVEEDTIRGDYNATAGYSHFTLAREQHQFELLLKRDSGTGYFALQGMQLKSDRPGIIYNAIGVNGAKLSSYLRCPLYTPQLAEVSPDLVIFSIGTNDGYVKNFSDSLYYANYCRLLDSTHKAAPHAAILLTVPNDSYLFIKAPNKHTAVIRKVIYQLAEEYGCGVWDFYTIMGGFDSSAKWHSLGLMKYDRVHFTRDGYWLKGDLFFSALLKAWETRMQPLEIPDSIPSLKPSSENR